MITHDVDEAVLLSDRIVMMTNGPSAHIGEVLEVSIPRLRERLELASNRPVEMSPARAVVPLPSATAAWRPPKTALGFTPAHRIGLRVG